MSLPRVVITGIGVLAANGVSARLFASARALLDSEANGVAYRLLGVAGTDLAPAEGADENDLIDRDAAREKSREAAIANLRDKFGAGSVQRGLAFGHSVRKS